MDSNKPFFIITGPSAVGKTAITKGLLAADVPVAKVITTTTRPSRAGETDGISYRFVDQPEFERLIAADQMFEWAEYAGNSYGSQRRDVESVLAAGKYPLWIVDPQGADYFKAHYPAAYIIFVVPSAFDILRTRMEKRGMAESDIRKRLDIAKDELTQAPKYDARVVNYDGKLQTVVAEVEQLIRRRLIRS